jgi:type IV fimbrial biogenesis protein FimT
MAGFMPTPSLPRPHAPHARRAGFTLIELMVAIAVLGTLAALAAPSFAAALQRQREASALQELIAAIQLGRAEAVRTGRQVVVRRIEPCAANQAAGNWRCGWQVFVDLDGDNQPDAGEAVVQHGGAHRGVWLQRAGMASIATHIQISRFGSLPIGTRVLAHTSQTAPEERAPGTYMCVSGTRIRVVHGTGCPDNG